MAMPSWHPSEKGCLATSADGCRMPNGGGSRTCRRQTTKLMTLKMKMACNHCTSAFLSEYHLASRTFNGSLATLSCAFFGAFEFAKRVREEGIALVRASSDLLSESGPHISECLNMLTSSSSYVRSK